MSPFDVSEDTADQACMQFVKSVLLREAERIHRDGYNDGTIVLPVKKGTGHYYLRTRVRTVQNSFNIKLYSVVFWFENYFVQTKHGNGYADLLIIIPSLT